MHKFVKSKFLSFMVNGSTMLSSSLIFLSFFISAYLQCNSCKFSSLFYPFVVVRQRKMNYRRKEFATGKQCNRFHRLQSFTRHLANKRFMLYEYFLDSMHDTIMKKSKKLAEWYKIIFFWNNVRNCCFSLPLYPFLRFYTHK